MSIREWAQEEMVRARFSAAERGVFTQLLDTFFGEFDSGGAVAVASNVLARLIAGQPLTPLTGDEDEWFDTGFPMEHEPPPATIYQNRRCSTVFRVNGRAYDINTPGRPTITFPYDPATRPVHMPIFEFGPEAPA